METFKNLQNLKDVNLEKILEYLENISNLKPFVESVEFIESLSNDILDLQVKIDNIRHSTLHTVESVTEELNEVVCGIISKYNLEYTETCSTCTEMLNQLSDEFTDDCDENLED